mgnify:FL=1
MSIKEINIDNLTISPLNVRTNIEKNGEKIQELSDNIKQHGLLNPLTVVLNKKNNKYEIIAGQRRYLAIKKLNYSSIKCNILELNDKECIYISLIENLQRDKMSLIDKVKTYKSLHSYYKCDINELSKNINLSITTIKRYLKISHLNDTILNRLDVSTLEGISLDFAICLVNLKITNQDKLLKIIEIFDDTTKSEKTQIIKHIQNQTKEDNHCDDFDNYIKKIKRIKIKYLTDKEKKHIEEEKIKKKIEEQKEREQKDKELKEKNKKINIIIKAYRNYILRKKINSKIFTKIKKANIIKKAYKNYLFKKKINNIITYKNKIKSQAIHQQNNYSVRNSYLQKEYRKEIIKRYKKCIISGMFEDVCEAAHIKPFCEADKETCFDINNGILLNRVLHKLFDSYDISINPITLNIEIKKCKNYEFIKMYENKHIEILTKYPETIIFLKEHYTEFKNN